MQLDVVVVTHNSSAHLASALGALPHGLNVVVVDNASSDDSIGVAQAHGATVIAGETNAGFAAACNRGAAVGDEKLILFLNPDAVIEQTGLERLIARLDDPAIGVVSPRLAYPDGARQRVQWPYPSSRQACGEALGLHRNRSDDGSDGFVIGACFMVRREAFEAAGGFDERFWLYGEEADLCRRIEDLGWSIERVANAAAVHVSGADGDGSSAGAGAVGEHFIRGGEHFVAKHEGTRGLVSYRLANLTGSVVRGGLGVGARSAEHRKRALRGLRELVSSPTQVDLDSPATSAPGKSLVVCSLEAWDEVWRRNQFFVRELLAADPDLRVLFVEPVFDVLHERRRGSHRKHVKGLRPVDAFGRVIRFEPVKWLPRKVGAKADEWRDDQVLDAVDELGFVDPRLWVNDPSYATLADRVSWPTVYDITDDWTKVADVGEAVKARDSEVRLLHRCEAVTVCSPDLFESRRSLRDDIVLIPNAVDFEHFCTPQPRPVDLPAGQCAVYVGTLHTDRLDVDLVCELANSSKDFSVVLVGPDALDAMSRSKLDAAGVIRLGARPYAEVPGYLQHADVVIVPHVVSAFTESLDPIKAYECASVGTPTVATPVAGFRDLGGPVQLASRDTFVSCVLHVLDDAPVPCPQPTPSWAERAAAFLGVLNELNQSDDQVAAESGAALGNASHVRRRRSLGTARLVLNARFRQRPITGVERYATELAARLPRGVRELGPNAKLAHPPMGHVWEQTRLPMLLEENDVLWSPCNTGPAMLNRHVVTIHDISPTEHPEWFSPKYARLLDALARAFVRNALHIVTDSEFTRGRLCDRLNADPDRVSIVRPGISERFCERAEPLSEAQRTELGLDNRPFVLSVATLEPRKNMAAAIEAFNIVQREIPDLVLVVAGNAGRKAIFAGHESELLRSSNGPNFIGYVPENLLPPLYRSAEALVYVPHYEGFGLPPLEAAAAGTPSVLSDIPVLRELGLPASYADPNDIESIAAAMLQQLTSAHVGNTDLSQYADGFSWESAAQQLFDVFASLGVDL